MGNDKNVDSNNLTAQKKLNNINNLFSAYGAFITGVFCIFQYFFAEHRLFVPVSAGVASVIFIITYFLAYSKMATKFTSFWSYISENAEVVGILNPIILAISIILSFSKSLDILLVCIVMVVLHIILYTITLIKHFKKSDSSLPKKLINLCKSNVALCVTIIFAVVFFLLWIICADKYDFADLWLNLLAGFISSAITISVIDKIIKKQKDKNEAPMRKAMYRDIQLFTSRFIGLWQEMYAQSTEKRTELSIEELFEPENINLIRENLNLEGFPNVFPKQTWFTYIEECRKDLVTRGEKIINAYLSIAEPEVIQSIHFLINDSFLVGNLSLMQRIHSCDLEKHIPRPALLVCYTAEPNDADKEMALQLFSWCKIQYKKLHDASRTEIKDIYPIPTKLTIINKSTPPTSIMNEEEKMKR